MSKSDNRIAVFPGTFDPITNGHLDVIRRGAALFEQLVIAVGHNPDKTCLLNRDERVEIITEVVADIPNVKVETYEGLTMDFVRQMGAGVILRGIRSSSDLHFESQVAQTNRVVAAVETIFIITKPEYSYISSSLIKQIAQMGGDVSQMTPPQVTSHIKRKVAGDN